MNRDLMMAILAMDSYNRGYGAGLLIGGDISKLGNATILADSESRPDVSGGQNAGFYASAYDMSDVAGFTMDEKVISYRGTNTAPYTALIADVVDGWAVGGGSPAAVQASLAVKFFNSVNGASDPRSANISFTGHSLGGGLAGLVGALYGLKGVLFDHMPFETAAVATYAGASVDASLRDLVYGGQNPWLGSSVNLHAYATEDEVLSNLRAIIPTLIPQELATFDANFPNLPFGAAVNRHSQALLAILMYGQKVWQVGGEEGLGKGLDWQNSAKYFLPVLFNDQIAAAAGFDQAEGLAGLAAKLQTAIAYSSIDEGERPYGDTGIIALFDDAGDLGKALSTSDVSQSLKDAANALAQAFVEYAGKLARGDVEGGAASSVSSGILDLSPDGLTLAVDFSADRWSRGAAHSTIVGRDTLIKTALATLGGATGNASDLSTGLNWLYGSPDTSIIDRVEFATTNDARSRVLPASAGLSQNVSLFVAGDGDDTTTGAADNEIIAGGKGADTIRGGDGKDLIAGGDGDDILSGGAGRDFIAGGAGFDTLDLDLGLTGTGADISLRAIPTASDQERGTIEIANGDDVDRIIDIEKVDLTNHSDKVRLLGDLGDYSGTPLTVDMRGSAVAFHQDEVDASQATAGIYFNLGSGNAVGLNKATDHGATVGLLGWAIPYIKAIFEPTDIQITGANSAIGTNYSDILIGSSGKQGSGEGYSALYGGAGNDMLIGAGWESHLYGGAGDDQFGVGANTIIQDAEAHDGVFYAGVPIFGGTKQWWMEAGTAYWSPFSTLMGAFPVIGASVLLTAALFIETATMKFANFQRSQDGDLILRLGWGWGGTATIKNYNLDLDSGVATGGVAVFQQDYTTLFKDYSLGQLTKYVNLALKAGFGVGLAGYDPLVLDLDGDGYELTTEVNSQVWFDYNHNGFAQHTGWVRGDDGLLVRDLNANGKIDDASELFGNATQGGFDMLAALDGNLDGVINASDAVYATLKVWQDFNQDGITDAGELKTLAELGIVSISLATTVPAEPTAVGSNQIAREGTFTLAGGMVHKLADVVFDVNAVNTRYLGDTSVSAAASVMPQLAGFGSVSNLRVAMTQDAALLGLVNNFANNATNDLSVLKSGAEAILYAWAGVASVATTALGSNGFDTRKLAFLEKYTGAVLMPRDAGGTPLLTNLAEMEQLWADQVTRLTLRLAVQGPLASTFAEVSYRSDLDLLIADGPTALGDILDRVIAGLPIADHTAALAQWADWAPLLGALTQSMVRADGNVVRADFLFAQLVRAADASTSPLTLQELAAGLGIANLHYGTAAAESLAHTAGETNVFFGNGGDDTLNGGTGQDVYVFGHAIGHSVINDVEAREGGDRIRFAFLNAGDVNVARSGDDLLITVTTTGETIRVVGQFAPVAPLSSDVLLSPNRGIEDIQFADGTIWETPEIMGAVGTGTSGNDHMVGTMHSDVFLGGAGDDLLEGGDDADLYVINAGDGHDTITDIQTTPLLRAADMVIFGDGIAPQDLVMTRVGATGDDLLFTIGSSGQTLLIKNQFAYSILGFNAPLAPNNRIEAFGFREYGDAWGLRDIQSRLIAQSTTSGNDTILGFGDDDVIDGGAGNDTLIGLDGQDTYLWGRGDGNDIVDERSLYIDVTVGLGGLSLTARADTVQFKDINRADLIFSRPTAAPDLLITDAVTGQVLTVRNQFAGFQTGALGAHWYNRMEWFVFADGTRLSWQDVQTLTNTGGNGNDSLYGDVTADQLVGGKGDDVLSGFAGSDTYQFNLGDGHDTLNDADTTFLGDGWLSVGQTIDVLQFGPGINPNDITFGRNGKDVDLIIGTAGDRVTLKGQDDYIYTGVFGAISTTRIEEIKFANGDVWTWHDLNQRMIAAATTNGNDLTLGTSTDDVFATSAGDDILDGGDGSDTYAFSAGTGHDIIREGVENIFAGDADKLVFAAGITQSDLAFSRQGEGLKISLVATGDSITIESQFVYSAWFTWNDIETFEFANGDILTNSQVQEILLTGSGSADDLVGFNSDDLLDGGAGDDQLSGGNGSDTYVFDRGYGHDVIHEGVNNTNLADYDTVRFGPGIAPGDILLSRSGNDLIISISNSDDTLTIAGQFEQAAWFSWNDIENFEFSDGTIWSKEVVAAKMLAGTSGDDLLVGTIGNDRLDGLAGNDTLQGGDGSDTYVFGVGYGHDTIQEGVSHVFLSDDDRLVFNEGITLQDIVLTRSGDDLTVSIQGTSDSITIFGQFTASGAFTWYDIERFEFADGTVLDKDQIKQLVLTGTPGNDTINGFDSNDILDGGPGDDALIGRDGNDTYRFGVGDGHDVIYEQLSDGRNGENDTLAFKPGVLPADVIVTRDGQDAVFTLASGDSVRVQGQFNEGYNEFLSSQDVECVTFADGTVWDKVEIDRRTIHPTAGDDVVLGTWYSQTYATLAGNDTVYAGGGDDILNGGAGNDRLEGGAGNDTYVYNVGDGEDVIWDDEFWGNGFNRISFGAGITAADLRIVGNSADGSEMVVQFANATGSIRILNQWASDPRIDGFTFADGTTWDISQIATAFASAQATPGNDTVVGTFGADFLTGGAGNDTLNGLAGDDTYVFNLGDGQDYIFDRGPDVWYGVAPGGYDKIQFGAGITAANIDVVQVSWNDIALKVRGTSDQIVIGGMLGTGFAAIEEVRFADGTLWSFTDVIAKSQIPTAGDDVIYSGYTPSALGGAAGNDTLHGSGSNDTLQGGTGNDTLYGNAGDDGYVFNLGDGQDYIFDRGPDAWYGVAPGGYDNIQFGVGIAAADIDVVQLSWNDIALRVRGTSDQIVIGGMIGYSFAAIEEVRFADGTVWSFAAVIARSQTSTSGDDTIYSGYTPSIISGGAGNDTLIGSDDTDTLLGGEGNDTLYGNNGIDVLAGGAGNDRLEGGGGNDIYRFGIGDGQDTIFDRGPDRWYGVEDGGFDRIEFGPGIAAGDIEIALSGNDMTFRIRGTADQITVAGMFNPAYSALEEVRFDDGTVWSRSDIIALTVDETPDPSWISGGSGNDDLWGTGGADTFLGGKGDDMLRGGGGGDTYRYRSGHGNDTIWDDGSGTDQDVLNLTNLNVVDVELRRVGWDLWIRDLATGQEIKVWEHFHPNIRGIEQLVFADGTTWDRAQIQTAAWLRGGDGNDVIYATEVNETLVGNKGNDDLRGGSGSDTYRYASGDGSDWLEDGGSASDTDVLKLTDLNSSAVELRRGGSNLFVRDITTGQEITVFNHFASAGTFGIEQLVFADGVTWDRAQIQAAAWFRGGDGNDAIYAAELNDTLVGNKGNDDLRGGSGSDTYRYASGDGSDWLEDGGSASDTDVLKLTDLNSSAVELRRGGSNLFVRDITTGQEITVFNHFASAGTFGIEQLVFADGVTWDRTQLQLLAERSGDDFVVGTSGNDTLYGMAGNDVITGLGGNDTLVGGTGNDYLDGDGFLPIGPNLVVNGSFEQLGPNPSFQGWGVWSDSLPGWTKTNSGRFNQVSSGVDGSPATDGQYLMDLDDSGGAGSNMDIRQTIGNLAAGQKLLLNFDHGNPRNSSSGYFEVYWNGELIATITDLGAQMRATQLTLTAVAGDNVLRFQGLGAEDGVGAQIDNVRLFATTAVLGNDVMHGGRGADTLVGGAGSDTYRYASGDGNDLIIDAGAPQDSDILELTDLDPSDVSVRREGKDAWIRDLITGQEIHIQDQFRATGGYGVEQVVFADGTIWDRAALSLQAPALAPEIASDSVIEGALAERVGSSGSALLDTASGALRFIDSAAGATHSVTVDAVSVDGAVSGLPANSALLAYFSFGAISEPGSGNEGQVVWTFAAQDSVFDYLAAGQSLLLTYSVTLANDAGQSVEQEIVVSVTGTNDAPVLSADSAVQGAVLELAGTSGSSNSDIAAGTLMLGDADTGDIHSASIVSVTATGITAGLPANATLLTWLSKGTLAEQAGATSGSLPWSFAAPDSSFDFLGADQVVTLTYAVQIADGNGGALNQNVVITVTGTNDGPVIAAGTTATGSFTELASVTGSNTVDTATGTIKFTDLDTSDLHTPSVASVAVSGVTGGLPANAALLGLMTLGSVTEQAGATPGSFGWTFAAPDAGFDHLRAGQTATLTYVIQVDDGHGGTLSQNVVVTITGTNDLPTIAAGTTATASLTELASVTGSTTADTGTGTVKFADADTGDTHTASVASVVASGVTSGLPANAALLAMLSLGTLAEQAGATPGSVSWTFSAQDKTFDYLGAGQTATLTYSVAVSDGQGGSVNQSIVVTVTGSNDGPVLAAGSTLTGTITELANTTGSTTNDSANGAIKFTDADIADVHSLTIASVTASGTTTGLPGNAALLAMLAAGAISEPVGATSGSAAWTFTAQDQTFDYLKPGQSATLTYAVQLSDGKGGSFSQNVVVTVNGSNDAPVVTVPAAQTARTSTATRIAGISVADADAGATETLTVTTSVGTIASTATGGATVSGSASKTMTISGTLAAVNSTLATLTYTAGASAGSDTIQIVSNDGTTINTKTIAQTVSTTANHGPAINAATTATGAFTEITGVSGSTTADTATGSIKFDDADVPDTHTVTVTSVAASGITSGLPANATLLTYLTKGAVTEPTGTTPGSVTWTFSAQDQVFDYLGVGQTATLTYVVTVADNKGGSTTQNVVITATGTNDAAKVSAGTTTGAITERASLTGSSLADTASGLVKFTDEPGDTHTASIVSVAASGATTGLPVNATMLAWLSKGALTEQVGATAGSLPWSFSAPDSAFDYLASGQTATLTYVVRVTDNLGAYLDQSVVVTATGANDAPTAQAKSGFTTDNWTALTITGATLLAGATDPDTGSTFTLSSVQGATGGTVALTSGNAVFTPSGTAIGPASFTYTISDGSGGTSTATVSITTTLHQINGTSTANTLAGNSTKKSQIDGLGGNDTITAGGVGDVIIGGAGTDTLTGGAGSDTFVYHAGFGLDTINSFTAAGTSKDVLQFDTSLFASWTHLLGATTQVGSDLVITLDAADKVTLKNVAMANFTSANAVFV